MKDDILRTRGFWHFQFGVWACIAVLTVLALARVGPEGQTVSSLALWGLVFSGTGLLASTGLAATYTRVPERSLQGVQAAGTLIVSCLVAGGLWWIALVGLEHALGWLGWEWFHLEHDDIYEPWHEATMDLLLGILQSALLLGTWSAVFLTTVLSSKIASARHDAMRAAALAKDAQLQILRDQLNPHFLFNTLNSVVTLIDENPERSQQMVRDVASLLRRSLEATSDEDGLVEDEIEFVRLYLQCEEIRFEHLKVSIDVPHEVRSRRLPPRLLHPLVENAIKHGLVNVARGVHIRIVGKIIEQDRVCLEVSNTGSLSQAQRRAAEAPIGIGLSNVRKRLKALFSDKHSFELIEQGGWVTARIEYQPSALSKATT